jgi:hypothetical protein
MKIALLCKFPEEVENQRNIYALRLPFHGRFNSPGPKAPNVELATARPSGRLALAGRDADLFGHLSTDSAMGIRINTSIPTAALYSRETGEIRFSSHASVVQVSVVMNKKFYWGKHGR